MTIDMWAVTVLPVASRTLLNEVDCMQKRELLLSGVLVLYLLVVGVGSAAYVAINFPSQANGAMVFPGQQGGGIRFPPFGMLASADQALALLALLAGMAGSFLHAAQSLSSYLGNGSFKASWATWYFLRPWIGGVLGFAIYFVFRAGLIAGVDGVNPYGVVALGLLGGWFSKTTTDKLQEVFETLFKTDEDKERKHKLMEPFPTPTKTDGETER